MDDVRHMSYLAEWYQPDLVDAAVDDLVSRVHAAAAAVSTEGTPVSLVATLAVPSDEVLYGVFDAVSSDAVVAACLRAGSPQQRLSADVVARFAPGAA